MKTCRAAIAFVVVLGQGQLAFSQPGDQSVNPYRTFGIHANNAFFYYADLSRAARFYTEVLGLRIVADYGFAKILQVAPSSFLTLVDATKGMHTADEPKTVALALLTDDLPGWAAHLQAAGVSFKHPHRPPVPGSPHDGFVAVDPEGYLLEIERFNPHPENAKLMPVLAKLAPLPVTPVPVPGGARPPALGFLGTVLWLYYNDLVAAQRFYEERLGFELVVDQGWAKVFRTSASGFLGLVDQARGMHRATQKKAVTASFLTSSLDRWFEDVRGRRLFELRSPAVHDDDEKRYRAFVGYDPEGYYLEFDTFLEHPGNAELLKALAAVP